ncbi:MAG: hypothetical protein AB7V48_15325 [Sedimentibacter sp.]
MEFVGELVEHKVFGSGTIVEFNDTFIVVKFENNSLKDFVFPNAFDSYLKLKNQELSKRVDEKLIVFRQKEAEKKAKEYEQKLEAYKLRVLKSEIENSRKSSVKKTDSNIAFKCYYCDGGKSNNSIGFKSVCSDDMIKYNINVAKNKVCSAQECNCHKYLSGNISRTELETRYNENNNFCYENKLLNQWSSYPDISFIDNKGARVKNLKNVNNGSLVLLSTVLPNEKEKDRIIFGVYLLKEEYAIDYNTKGFLGADDKYKIELTLEESKNIKFWDYYFNPKNPEKIVNSSITYRYFDDVQSAQVLKTISEIKKGTPDEAISNEIFQRYCSIKNIDFNAIPAKKGALQAQKSHV